MAQPTLINNTAKSLPFHVDALPTGIRYTKRQLGTDCNCSRASSMVYVARTPGGYIDIARHRTAAHCLVARGGSINAPPIAKNDSKHQPN